MLTFRLFYKIKQNDEYRRYQNDSYQTFISYRENEVVNKTINNTEYFRPSQLPILNDREFKSGFLGEFYMKEPNEIILPNYLLESPEDSIINFFSI
jgi:hypothetical protein